MRKGQIALRSSLSALVLSAAIAGCGGSTTLDGSGPAGGTRCRTGSERCACSAANACDVGLVCASGLCVSFAGLSFGGSGGTAQAMSGGTAPTGGTPWLLTGGTAPMSTGGTAALSGTGGTHSAACEGDLPNVVLFAAWSSMSMGGGFRASWRNDTDHSIFVDKSCVASWWRYEGGTWVPGTGSDTCSSTSRVELLPGGIVLASNSYNLGYYGAGIYQLRGTFWLDCPAGSTCTAACPQTSPDVWAWTPATGTGGTAGTGPAVNSGELRAPCGEDGPCPPGQTAVGAYGIIDPLCTCEIPCEQGSTTCPSGTTCDYFNASFGYMCQ